MDKVSRKKALEGYKLGVATEKERGAQLVKQVKHVEGKLKKFLDAHTSILRHHCGEITAEGLHKAVARLTEARQTWESEAHG